MQPDCLAMGRTVLTIVLIGLAFWVLSSLWRRISNHKANPVEPAFEKTVQCAHCQAYVSIRLAHERNGRYYCCAEHLPE